jgi:hypothetical protein
MDLREQLAAIEHQRWADWQQYLHSVCIRPEHLAPGIGPLDQGCLVIPTALVERWERQIATKYEDLTEGERASDLEQVNRYWPLIADAIELAEYLLTQGTSAKEVLDQLRSETHAIVDRDYVDYRDPRGIER